MKINYVTDVKRKQLLNIEIIKYVILVLKKYVWVNIELYWELSLVS